MTERKVFGPYRVKDIGVDGSVYEVVSMVDNHSNTWEELRPRYTSLSRQAAYGKCLRLNKRWQEEHEIEDTDLLAYWQEATN